MKATAMVQVADRRLEPREFTVPPTTADTGLLRVEACGLCGSDLEQYLGHFAAKGMVEYPVIPGHEAIGILDEVGATAAARWGVQAGDRVAVVPALSCGRCTLCLRGRNNLCRALFPDVPFPGYGYIPLRYDHGLWGGYSTHQVLHPSTMLCPVPPTVPPNVATLYQALASGLHWAVSVAGARFGDRVLILGSGQRGLAAVVALRACGAGNIFVTGLARDAHKLQLARQLGASYTIVADEQDTVAVVRALTDGEGVDIVLDTVPADVRPVIDAIASVRTDGTVVLAGLKGSDIRATVDTDELVRRNITLRGVFSQPVSAYADGMRLLESRLDDLSALHTHDFALTDAVDALDLLHHGSPADGALSITLRPT